MVKGAAGEAESRWRAAVGAGSGILMAVAITDGTMLVLAGVGLPFLINAKKAQRLLAVGLPARAVVDSMADTGMTVNGRPVVSFRAA